MISGNDLDLAQQLAHVAWGALLFVALDARLAMTTNMNYVKRTRIVFGIVMGIAIIKEVFIESIFGWLGPIQPWPKCSEDVAFWSVGIALGYLIQRFHL